MIAQSKISCLPTARPFQSHGCRRNFKPKCTAGQTDDAHSTRRDALQVSTATLVALLLPKREAWSLPAGKVQAANVGSYLPKASVDGFCTFKPDEKKTSAIRAGVIKADNAYGFILPSSWTEARIANIASGNFCMPRCDEPWTEVVFQDPGEGKLTLTVMNLRKLTNKASASIDQVGSPEGILQSVGPFITGTFLDEEDVVSATKETRNGRSYYSYEVNSLTGNTGPHFYSVATTKDDLAYLFTLAASDKQWKAAQKKLKEVAQSFHV